jgi:formate hydrogenlyase transcriptional activator
MSDLFEPRVSLEDRLRFEMLLTALAARFVNVTAETINDVIVDAQRQIVEALELDRSTLAQAQPNGEFLVTHTWAIPGVPLMPGMAMADVPWIGSALARGEDVAFSRVEDLPEEAERDKATIRRLGPLSSLVMPFRVGGKVIGAMAFGTVRRERDWSDVSVGRLRLIVDVIGNALARSRAEEASQKALDEIRRLRNRLERENAYLHEQSKSVRERAGLIGESQALRSVLVQVAQVAPTNSNVLLVGETGTGKELVASAIHEQSLRSSRLMVRVNCAAIPGSLIESELFGREKGAYTGALSRQVGRFEVAHDSSLFLDEVGELPLELQTKLLRVLEHRKFERLGSSKSIAVDVRIIAATNRNLERAVREKTFRDDLFYRLNVFPIHVPPLRERLQDIPLLVKAFVQEFAVSMGKKIEHVDDADFEALQHYSWPGNIRELRNVVERAVISSTDAKLQISAPSISDQDPKPSLLHLDVEREHVRSILELTGWRIRGRNGAAEILGIKPTTLDSMIVRLGLTRKQKDSYI